jgi:hypothetical protein
MDEAQGEGEEDGECQTDGASISGILFRVPSPSCPPATGTTSIATSPSHVGGTSSSWPSPRDHHLRFGLLPFDLHCRTPGAAPSPHPRLIPSLHRPCPSVLFWCLPYACVLHLGSALPVDSLNVAILNLPPPDSYSSLLLHQKIST